MIVFLTLVCVAALGLLVWMGKIPNTAKTWFPVPIWMVLLLVVLFFPMQLGGPSGPARLMTYSVSVIPNVAGTVTEVVAQPNQPLKKGDVLFKLDPRPYLYLLEAKKSSIGGERAESSTATSQSTCGHRDHRTGARQA